MMNTDRRFHGRRCIGNEGKMLKRAVYAGIVCLMSMALSAQATDVVYQSDFTGTTLASAGLAASAGAAGGGWAIDTVNDQLDGTGGGNARASVYTTDSWQNDLGFTLEVTFWGHSALVRHSFGIVDAAYSIPAAVDWLNQSPAGAYGIGFHTAGEAGADGLSFNNDAGTLTVLSTAQGDKTSAATETMTITVTRTSWSYSLNGAAATTGTFSTPFDTSRSYRFIAYAQRASRANFSNITLRQLAWDGDDTGGDQTWTDGDSNSWSTATYNNGDDAKFLGDGLGTVTLSGTINPGSVTVNSAADYTFSGAAITGTGALTKNGTGTLTVNTANTYSGTTTVNAGVLQMGNNSALGSGGLVTTVSSGAALNLNGADNINEDISIVGVGPGVDGALYNAGNTASISASRTLTLTGDATIGGALRIDIHAAITDNASDYTLTKVGTGGINLWTTNLDVANLDIQAASVIIKDLPRDTLTVRSGATAVGWQLTDWGAGDIVLESGATIQTSRNVFTTAANISISGTANLKGNNNSGAVTPDQATYSGDITGTGGLTIWDFSENQDYQFILSGSNSYSGGTTVGNSSRAVALLAGSTTGLSSNSAFNVTTNATLKLNGNNNTIASLTGAGTVENDNASAATLTAGDASNTTFSGALQDGAGGGALSLIKTGAGTLILQDAQTYTGTTTVNAGTLQLLGTSGSIHLTSTYQINNGSTLYLNDTTANFFLVDGSDDFTFGSNGGGTLSLTGNILWRNATIATTGGARNFVSGGAFNHQNTRSIIFDSAVGTDVDGIDLEVSTRVERGSIVKDGAGTVLLTNANNRPLVSNSITINDGTLEVGSAGQIDTSGGANGDWSGPLTLNNDGVFKHSSSNVQTLSGAVSGTGSVEKINGTAVLVLAGTSTYSGTTTLGDGAGTSDSLLWAGSSTGLSPNSAFTINSDGALFLEGFDNTIASLAGPASAILRNSNGAAAAATLTTGGDGTSTEFAGFIQDGGGGASVLSLVKEGGGTMTLSGTSIYTGTTTVSAGELTVTGTSGSGAHTVASGATLSGTGTIGGTVTISSGGILSPGL